MSSTPTDQEIPILNNPKTIFEKLFTFFAVLTFHQNHVSKTKDNITRENQDFLENLQDSDPSGQKIISIQAKSKKVATRADQLEKEYHVLSTQLQREQTTKAMVQLQETHYNNISYLRHLVQDAILGNLKHPHPDTHLENPITFPPNHPFANKNLVPQKPLGFILLRLFSYFLLGFCILFLILYFISVFKWNSFDSLDPIGDPPSSYFDY